MSGKASLWGAHWLGDPALWGSLSSEMTARWGEGQALPATDSQAEPNLVILERLGLGALAGSLAAGAASSSTNLFYSLSNTSLAGFPLDLVNPPSPFVNCVPVKTQGVVGGLELVAYAQQRLTKGLLRAVCLAGGGFFEKELVTRVGRGEGAAALGIGVDLDKGLCRLGLIEQGQYDGVPDSGAQTDFLERVGRKAKGGGPETISAIVLNRPPDLKWQASLDAAARRVAPLARRYVLPVDPARQAGGLMLIMAGLTIATPRPKNPRLVLAVDQTGKAAAVKVSPS